MPGYDQPQPPKDAWAARLYREYGLSDTSTMAEIEPIATRLLEDIATALSGAELVLGRRIDGREESIAHMYYPLNGATAKERFALLLLHKGLVEDYTSALPPSGDVGKDEYS